MSKQRRQGRWCLQPQVGLVISSAFLGGKMTTKIKKERALRARQLEMAEKYRCCKVSIICMYYGWVCYVSFIISNSNYRYRYRCTSLAPSCCLFAYENEAAAEAKKLNWFCVLFVNFVDWPSVTLCFNLSKYFIHTSTVHTYVSVYVCVSVYNWKTKDSQIRSLTTRALT